MVRDVGCKRCGSLILRATAEKMGGLCIHCSRKYKSSKKYKKNERRRRLSKRLLLVGGSCGVFGGLLVLLLDGNLPAFLAVPLALLHIPGLIAAYMGYCIIILGIKLKKGSFQREFLFDSDTLSLFYHWLMLFILLVFGFFALIAGCTIPWVKGL